MDWVEQFKKKSAGKPKEEGRENPKVVGRMAFFIFIFSLLVVPILTLAILSDTAFRMFSLGNLFFKNVFIASKPYHVSYRLAIFLSQI